MLDNTNVIYKVQDIIRSVLWDDNYSDVSNVYLELTDSYINGFVVECVWLGYAVHVLDQRLITNFD